MSFSIQCPNCQAVLKSPTPIPGGKTVKCPKCKQPFTTPDEAPPPEETPANPIPDMEIPDEDVVEEEVVDEEVVDEEIVDEEVVDEEIEDDEEVEKPKKARSKKNKKDDDEPDEKKKKKKKKKAGSSMMLFVLGGGVFVLLLCCMCGVGGGGGYFYFSKPLVGKWEPDDFKPNPFISKTYIEFGYFGSGKSYSERDDKGKKLWTITNFTYTTTGKNPMLLEIKQTSFDTNDEELKKMMEEGKKLAEKFKDKLEEELKKERLNVKTEVTVNGDTMTMTHILAGNRIPTKFRRVR